MKNTHLMISDIFEKLVKLNTEEQIHNNSLR